MILYGGHPQTIKDFGSVSATIHELLSIINLNQDGELAGSRFKSSLFALRLIPFYFFFKFLSENIFIRKRKIYELL